MKIALVILTLILILAAAAVLPVRPYLDFQVIFHAGLGLLRGISLYDHTGQVEMIAQLANVPPSRVYVLPFPYPPWYALSTIWLAALPINLAARVWMALNLVMLLLSVGLLTPNERPVRRVLLVLGAILWLPALGSLFVGQYGFPVLLGAALTIHALRREDTMLLALAAALLTFKPHLGGVVLLLVIFHLVVRGDRFARKALPAILAVGAILFGLGFLASPSWPLAYLHSLTDFREVSQCGQCVSLPMAVAGLGGGSFSQAIPIALGLLVVAAAWLVWRWRDLNAGAGALVVMGILTTLLVSPYLQNYDYLLLVIPFIEIARDRHGAIGWIALALAYTFPLVGLAVWGTAANVSLIVSACILFAVRALDLKPAQGERPPPA